MKLCAGKHRLCSVHNANPGEKSLSPSSSISFDTQDVMQQLKVSCGPAAATEREGAAVISNFDML